jgi:hypothetical protein
MVVPDLNSTSIQLILELTTFLSSFTSPRLHEHGDDAAVSTSFECGDIHNTCLVSHRRVCLASTSTCANLSAPTEPTSAQHRTSKSQSQSNVCSLQVCMPFISMSPSPPFLISSSSIDAHSGSCSAYFPPIDLARATAGRIYLLTSSGRWR